MKLWTFIADFMGGTYISQCSSESIETALDWFAIEQPSKKYFRFLADDSFYDAVQVTDTQSVWCTNVLDLVHENLVTLHIVETAGTPALAA